MSKWKNVDFLEDTLGEIGITFCPLSCFFYRVELSNDQAAVETSSLEDSSVALGRAPQYNAVFFYELVDSRQVLWANFKPSRKRPIAIVTEYGK